MPEMGARFRESIIESGYVLDPEGVHHEFVSGLHGQKLDFDNIANEDPLYGQWINTTAHFIQSEFPKLPELIVGVANGTNRVARDVARRFDWQILSLASRKDPGNSKVLELSRKAQRVIAVMKPQLIVVKEDVGTTGFNSAQVAQHCLEAGAKHVEVVITWKRRAQLDRLETAGIPYRAIIAEELPTYTPEDCHDHGFCAQGWELIERSS